MRKAEVEFYSRGENSFEAQKKRIDEACKSIESTITVISQKIKDLAEVYNG